MKATTGIKILLVEDDHLQAKLITESIERAFAGVQVDWIETEAEFRSNMRAIEAHPPDIVVMDVMLRWTNPTPDMTVPPERVRSEGYQRAGIRCVEVLAERKATKNIPVILFTIVSRSDLEVPPSVKTVVYLSKGSEPEELTNQIWSIVTQRDQSR